MPDQYRSSACPAELGWPATVDQSRAVQSCTTYVMDRGNLHGYGYGYIHDGGEPSLG